MKINGEDELPSEDERIFEPCESRSAVPAMRWVQWRREKLLACPACGTCWMKDLRSGGCGVEALCNEAVYLKLSKKRNKLNRMLSYMHRIEFQSVSTKTARSGRTYENVCTMLVKLLETVPCRYVYSNYQKLFSFPLWRRRMRILSDCTIRTDCFTS